MLKMPALIREWKAVSLTICFPWREPTLTVCTGWPEELDQMAQVRLFMNMMASRLLYKYLSSMEHTVRHVPFKSYQPYMRQVS